MAAITASQYSRRAVPEWRGVKVRSLRALRNGWAEMPAGTIFTITRKFSGFDLESDPCEHCGIKMRISRVQPQDLELVDA
jgi:hypothetical protein